MQLLLNYSKPGPSRGQDPSQPRLVNGPICHHFASIGGGLFRLKSPVFHTKVHPGWQAHLHTVVNRGGGGKPKLQAVQPIFVATFREAAFRHHSLKCLTASRGQDPSQPRLVNGRVCHHFASIGGGLFRLKSLVFHTKVHPGWQAHLHTVVNRGGGGKFNLYSLLHFARLHSDTTHWNVSPQPKHPWFFPGCPSVASNKVL